MKKYHGSNILDVPIEVAKSTVFFYKIKQFLDKAPSLAISF